MHIYQTKYSSLLVLIVSIISLACDRTRPIEIIIGKPRIVDIEIPKNAINPALKFKFANLDLYQNIQSINLEQFTKYGSFYTRDFTIYKIKNLDLLEDNLYISEIYLYFIDNSLLKIQAFTTKNMSDFFLSKYGGAKLVLKDRFNKDLVLNEGAVSRKAGKTHMNKSLSNYKLKWKNTDRLISYQVDESAQKSFEALEELINIENQQYIKTKPSYVFTIQSESYNQLLSRVKYDEVASNRKNRNAN
jgi:hypothetical protein